MALSKITNEKRELLKQKSAQSLPDVPSLHNWTPKQFKNAITKVLFDNNDSFFAYFNTLTDELEDQFLTKEDDKIVLMETTFSGENKFALEVLKEVENHSKPKIYFASIATSAADKRTVVGVYQKASGGNYVLILDGNGSIKLSNGTALMDLAIPNLSSYKAVINEARFNRVILDDSMDATKASIDVGTPSVSTNPTTKKYVDDIQTELQNKINGIEAAQNLLDIVANKTKLDSWTTDNPDAKLHKNDKIKVLEDKDYGNAGTYYKWNGQAWEYIGKDGIYYTQTEVDTIKNNLQAQIDSLKGLINTLTSNNVSYKEE